MICHIAQLYFDVPEAGGLAPRCRDYQCDAVAQGREVLKIREDLYVSEYWPNCSYETISYMESGHQFHLHLLRNNGLMLHSSAVAGDNGLMAMQAALESYFDLGGFAVHYNVLDVETLKDAKSHPEKYPNLQVRLCGWNVLFSTLSNREKDEFILRSSK